MKKIITLLTLFSSLITFSQTTTIINQKLFGGINDEGNVKIKKMIDNSLILVSNSKSGATGNKTLSNFGGEDLWVINLDNLFNINWQVGIGGSLDEYIEEVLPTQDGGFIVLGSSNSPISGNKTAINKGDFDFWIIKFNNLGIVEWEKTFGGTGYDYAYSISTFSNGDYLIGGVSNSPISGDKTSSSFGDDDYWLIRIDNLGSLIWDKTIGASSKEQLTDLYIDASDNVFIVGTSWSDVSGDKTEDNFGSQNVWILKMDNTSTIIWDKTLGGNVVEYNPKIISIDNYLYLNCGSSSPVSGNKTDLPEGQGDFWLLKLDTNATIIWDKSIGMNQGFSGELTNLSNGSMLMSGSFYPTGNSLSSDYLNVFVDTNGIVLYNEIIEADSFDPLTSIFVKDINHYVYVGNSNSPISGDKTITPIGGADIWLVEVTTNLGVSEQIVTNHYNLYPNPNNGVFTITGLTPQSKVEVFSIDGKLKKVFNTIQSSELQISNLGLSKGMYFAKISETNTTKSIKFCVQ